MKPVLLVKLPDQTSLDTMQSSTDRREHMKTYTATFAACYHTNGMEVTKTYSNC